MNKTKISCAIVTALALNPAIAQQDKSAKAQIETIQVTATKRTESIQDVPVSVSALNGEALESLGVEIRFAKLNEDASIDPRAIEELIDHNTRVVAVAAVRFNSGFRPNLSKISEIAHSKNALFILDAAQGAGMVPIDVVKDGIDIMAGCGFKWLLGMHGTGFLYVSNRVVKKIQPVLPGMYAAEIAYDTLSYYEDARKFETGTLAYPLFNAWSAGIKLLLSIGILTVYKKEIENTTLITNGILKNN